MPRVELWSCVLCSSYPTDMYGSASEAPWSPSDTLFIPVGLKCSVMFISASFPASRLDRLLSAVVTVTASVSSSQSICISVASSGTAARSSGCTLDAFGAGCAGCLAGFIRVIWRHRETVRRSRGKMYALEYGFVLVYWILLDRIRYAVGRQASHELIFLAAEPCV